jgi:hypothetical protein
MAQTTSSSASATSSKGSSPSPGLIAGAVIGGIAVLLLFGILVMLILRHKRKARHQTNSTTEALASERGASRRSLDETLVERTPMTQHQVLAAGPGYVANEKELYRSSHPNTALPQESEMETSANVWELDGRERERPVVSELESPVTGTNGWGARRTDHRGEHSELRF